MSDNNTLKSLVGKFNGFPKRSRPRRPRVPKKEKPFSTQSEGAKRIEEWLIKEKVEFEKEKRFDTCRNPITNRTLPFDFWLPKYNLLCEFDGAGHYFKVDDWYDTNEKFESRQARDRIKDEWCAANNVKLLRIEFSKLSVIERILKVEIGR